MSLPDGLNIIRLLYGKFVIEDVVQDAGGNIITVWQLPSGSAFPLAVGDYIYCDDNTNLESAGAPVEVIAVGTYDPYSLSITVTVDMSDGAGTVSGGTLYIGKQLNVLHVDNENIEILAGEKERNDKVILENIKGYRTLVDVQTEALTDAERLFLYQFAKSDYQMCEVFGSVYTDVLLQESELVADLIENYIQATSISFTLAERNLTAPASAYSAGTTSSAGYFASSPLGTRVKLTMNWGAGAISRNFTVNLANIYDIKLERKDWEHVDDSLGRVNFGFRVMASLDFGTFGYQTTVDELQADLAWLKNFILAPSKHIEVYEVFQSDVVNDFDTFEVGYLGGFIFAKTLSLSFKGKSLQQLQSNATGVFTLDDNDLGILDENYLG